MAEMRAGLGWRWAFIRFNYISLHFSIRKREFVSNILWFLSFNVENPTFIPGSHIFNDFNTFSTCRTLVLPSLDHYFQVIYSAHIVSFFKHLFWRKHKKLGVWYMRKVAQQIKGSFFQRKMIKCDFRVIY